MVTITPMLVVAGQDFARGGKVTIAAGVRRDLETNAALRETDMVVIITDGPREASCVMSAQECERLGRALIAAAKANRPTRAH